MRLKPVRAYAIVSPVGGEHIATYGMCPSPDLVRSAAVEIGHVFGGKAEGETWATLRKRGYRIVPVIIRETPKAKRT